MILRSLVPLVLLSVCCPAVVFGQTHVLMPVPAEVAFGAGRLPVTPAFSAHVAGCRDARVEPAVLRALRRLQGRTGIEFATPVTPDASAAALVVECARAGGALPSLADDESYAIEVTDRQARLRAAEGTGALRGLETLLQLVSSDRAGAFVPAVRIDDRPRFRWRGLLVDAARHWMPVGVVKRNLDGMAGVKLNVLHWHLTEDQGFRVESRKYPKLHSLGSDGLFYTQDQIREVVAYAAARGIRVIPEFDMPGHVTSWLVGHPELAAAPGPYTIARTWGVFDAAFDPTREEVYRLLDGFLGEMAALFPDEYLHIGGDENEGKQWAANAAIQAFMKKQGLADAHALQAYFNRRVSAILRKHGKKMVGWDEILHPDLPKDIVVQSWRGQESLATAARQGYQGLLSNGWYLDLMETTARHYLVDPVPVGSTLTTEETARVLGGEACMWAEYVSPDTVDSRIWPRLGAVAERLWSPATVADVPDMYRRLAVLSVRLEELGLEHEKNVDALLRRLAGTTDIGPLRTLVDAVEPVQGYRRGRLRPATQMMPLTRVVDAARADSAVGRRVAALVDELLADAPAFRSGRAELEDLFTRWRDIRPSIDVVIDRAAGLHEMRPLAESFAALGVSGLQALAFLQVRVSPADDWRSAQLALSDRASQPVGEVVLSVAAPLRRLAVAAAEVQALETMTPAEWKARVERIAAPPPQKR
jgi:hexosaminidase